MAISQPVTVYSDTAAQVRVISDYIFNIDPMDTPVVARFGLDSANSKFKLSQPDSHYKVELLEDTFGAISTTLNNGTTVTTSTLTMTVTSGGLFQDGFVILIDSEYMVVSGVSGNVITVDSRAYGGTNATHAATAAVSIVGMARKEADDADYVNLTSLTNPYNYTAIYQKGIKVSGSEYVLDQYGKPGGEWVYQENKTIPELSRLIERAFFHGQRRQGSATVARSFGGVGTFVTTNSSSITTTITKASIDALAKTIFDAGQGHPDVLICGSNAANTIRNLYDSSSFLRVTPEQTTFGMRPVTRVNMQFYENVELIVSRHCPAKKAYLLDSSKVGFFTYRPFASSMLAKTGDSVAGEVVGEFSLLIANNAAHGYFITTATAL